MVPHEHVDYGWVEGCIIMIVWVLALIALAVWALTGFYIGG